MKYVMMRPKKGILDSLAWKKLVSVSIYLTIYVA